MQTDLHNGPQTRFRDDPDFFPQLDIHELREQAHTLSQNYPIIHRIILYRNSSPVDPDLYTPTYVLAIEIRNYEQIENLVRLKKENPEAVQELRKALLRLKKIEKNKEEDRILNGENLQNKKETRPFREVLLCDPNWILSKCAKDILLKTEEISGSAWSEVVNQFQPDSLRSMFGEPFSRVIRPEHLKRLKETKNSWWDEWIVCLCRPGEEPAEVLTDRFWVLYEAESVSQSEVEDLRMSFARDYGPAAQLLLKDVRRSIKDEGLDQYDGRIQKEETISIFGVNPSRYNPLTTTLLEREDVYPWVTGQEPRKFIGTIIQLAAMSKGVKLTQEEAYQAFMKIKNSAEN